ncbi:DNA repair protein REV1 [Melia azedarach]|uniref:DNA repair protein REV1 n=2 Tax=Melia azedarach TaxID=155640 RepID=A0ACC1XXR5_MELAZ|nr:DNA repair protein REV1 [Melia azedarach]
MSFDSSRSASSRQQSKRSFNSNHSNNSKNNTNSSGNSDDNKKRKSNQKTLGAAWGSNSLSSSRPSFGKSPFSDFGSYMVEKNRKLQNQFDAEASSSSHSASTSGTLIFQGVSIFVDGFTVPSSQELRGYMLKYGGRFENYFSKRRVTHIICSNLPDSKIKNLRSFSGGLPVVKPTWIMESVAANKLLSWVPYQLDQLANNQPKLSDFFASKSNHVSKDASITAVYEAKAQTDDSSLNDGRSKNAGLSEPDESMEHERPIRVEIENPVLDNTKEKMIDQKSCGAGKSCEINMAEPTSSDIENESSVKNEHKSSTFQPYNSVISYCFDDNSTLGSTSSTAGAPSRKRHSTLGDPNFVENYFKSSRLHFIGTWRNRYRKRFPNCGGLNLSSSTRVPSNVQRTAIIHVDMDCFFVSVVIRNHPELQQKPVAVCHSDNAKGTAEISSANYPARGYGVRAGMFVRNAKALCPHLVIFPYNFEAYEEVADQLYNILHKHCNKVQAVSCDEAFLDVTDLEGEDPELLASKIRKEIFETTGCTASTGIAGNMLMARLATRTAKPNGQCYIPPEGVDEYLNQLPIKALPGIGYALEEKLKRRNVWTCGQLRMISKDSLQKDFGAKTGEMLWNYSRGVDNRQVGLIQESKSIGADVNWGVRFRDLKDSQNFLSSLCKEVSLRLQGCAVRGRTFTLKIKKRKKDADEPIKFMGCGDCDNLSHSITVPVATDDVEVLQRITKQLFGSFHLDVKDIRGVGLQVSKLESADTSKQGVEGNTLRSWLISASASTEEQYDVNSMTGGRTNMDSIGQSSDGTLGQLCADANGHSFQMENNQSSCQTSSNQALPPLCHLDIGVVENLPPELFSELNETYGGKLVDFIAKNKGKSENIGSALCNSCHEPEGAVSKGKCSLISNMAPLNGGPVEVKAEQCTVEKAQAVFVSRAGFHNGAKPTSGPNEIDLMPSSLTQVDTSVLQQLPEELRADILEMLPAHRKQESSTNAALVHPENLREVFDIRTAENLPGLDNSLVNSNLWAGNPPLWVDKFKASNFLILNILADNYYKSGSTENLSQILQHTVSKSLHPLDSSSAAWDEAIYSLSELLRQYIELKIQMDIEEIYVCFRLLRRIMVKSEFFLQVYNIVLPYLQTSVGQNYGGSMHL